MKILFTTWKDIYHPTAGETEEILWNYAQRLGEKGHSVYILSSAFEGCNHEEKIENINVRRIANIHTLYFKIGRHYSENFKHKFDIIINECLGSPLLLPQYDRHTPFLLFIRHKDDVDCDQEFKYPLSKIGRFFHNRVISIYNENLVLTSSIETKKGLISQYGFKEENIFSLENEILTQNLQIKKKESILMFSKGNTGKNVELSIKAFEKIRELYPNYQLGIDITNENEEIKTEIIKYIKKHSNKQNAGHISIFNRQEKAKISEYKLIFITSLTEDYSEQILEASFHGTPSIGFHIPKTVNHLKNEINGHNVEKGNIDELIKKSIEIIEKPGDYNNLVQKTFGYFEQQKKYSNNSDSLETILQSIINTGNLN